MILSEVLRRGLLQSKSMRRWLADGDIPGVRTSVAYRHDLSIHEVAICRIFELAAAFGSIPVAQAVARDASQKVRAGIISPVVVREKYWTLEFDLVAILDEVNKEFQR